MKGDESGKKMVVLMGGEEWSKKVFVLIQSFLLEASRGYDY